MREIHDKSVDVKPVFVMDGNITVKAHTNKVLWTLSDGHPYVEVLPPSPDIGEALLITPFLWDLYLQRQSRSGHEILLYEMCSHILLGKDDHE